MYKPSIMKKLLFLLFPFSLSAQITSVEEIITGNVFCIHSEIKNGATLFNTSNCYLLKGTNDTVWSFGMGYGKPEDIRIYRDCTTINTSFTKDMHQVDSVINLFGFSNPKVMFIVPHFHLDHANQEFIFGIDSMYNTLQSKIYVHLRDYTQCTCNAYCCGFGPCSLGSVFFGAPYDVSWANPVIAQFVKIGFKTDTCNRVLKTFTTSYGNWQVVKGSTTHTPGTLNLRCPSKNVKILGADSGSPCWNPTGCILLPIHGNCGLGTPINP